MAIGLRGDEFAVKVVRYVITHVLKDPRLSPVFQAFKRGKPGNEASKMLGRTAQTTNTHVPGSEEVGYIQLHAHPAIAFQRPIALRQLIPK